MTWLDEGPPIPRLEGWRAVGSRLEWSVPNSSPDFDVLFLEQVLIDNDIECVFYPHRPNEGFSLSRPIINPVWLYVRDADFDNAAQLAADVAASVVLLPGEGESEQDGEAE
ncbi:MAG: hypothetical protein FDZ75_05805 [Actinobacteria bacterium]|nr:MAG: hypothetical protein FDZ75_05805 [Actinomycetota bacterium]